MSYFIVIFRTVFFYFLITLIYRLLGKREVGELSIIDLIVSIFIAELAAISIDNYKESIFLSIVPMLILVFIQYILAKISLQDKKIRNIVDGKPSVIINRGIINFKEMLKQRYNLDDLLTQLRDKSIKSIEEIDYAILENSGKLSVFPKKDDSKRTYPLPVIIDGKVISETLRAIKKDEQWLIKELTKKNYNLKDVFYAFYKNNNLFIIKNDYLK